jgi:hypothetical protein
MQVARNGRKVVQDQGDQVLLWKKLPNALEKIAQSPEKIFQMWPNL